MPKRPPKPTATNTVHFACFDCRKSFKQPGSSNCDPDLPQRPYPCPNCKRSMVRLGRYFKAPTQRAVRQWLKVELLYHYGEHFWSGHSRLGVLCKTLPDAVRYLAVPPRSENEVRKVLNRIRESHNRKSNCG